MGCNIIGLGYRNLQIESDNTQLIQYVKSNPLNLSSLGALVEDILQPSNSFESYNFFFVPREADKVAHALARLSKDLKDESVWLEDHPPLLVSVLVENFCNSPVSS